LTTAAGLKQAPPSLYAAMFLMTTLWSMNFYAAKVLTAELWAFPAAGFRSIFGAMAICTYYALFVRGNRSPGGVRPALRYMALGTIGVGLNQYLFMEGMARTSISHGALIIALTPAIVLLLAMLTGQERMTAMKLGGLALATAGIAFLQRGADRGKGATLFGDALVLSAATSFATYTILTKRLAGQARGITVVTFGFIGSALAFVPGMAWAIPQVSVAQVNRGAWLALAYMAVCSSMICYIIYYRALESMPASRVSALSYLQPLIAITTAIPLLGEPITKSLVIGGILILLGVLLAERG
jgi:drug/metabolite transporter (DMT)-like permease